MADPRKRATAGGVVATPSRVVLLRALCPSPRRSAGRLDILDYTGSSPEEALALLLDFDDILVPVNIPLSPGMTLPDAIARSKEYTAQALNIIRRVYGRVGDLDLEAVETGYKAHRVSLDTFVEPLVSVALYLCATTAEFRSSDAGEAQPANPAPVRTRRTGMRLFPPNKPRVWEVSYRLGAALRRAEAEQVDREPARGGRASPRPHIRRAHWHSYRTGPRDRPEEQHLNVRWLPPLRVSFGDDGEVVPTIRAVQ